MFCSKCGRAVADDQAFCANCGRPVKKLVAPTATEEQMQQRFNRTMQMLGRFLYLFAGLNLALGAVGLVMMQFGMTTNAGPWEPWPHPPAWQWTMAGGVAWTLLVSRMFAAALAAWGLLAHAEWGRPVALLAGAMAFVEFPIGMALGVYTWAKPFGRKHGALYRGWARLEPAA